MGLAGDDRRELALPDRPWSAHRRRQRDVHGQALWTAARYRHRLRVRANEQQPYRILKQRCSLRGSPRRRQLCSALELLDPKIDFAACAVARDQGGAGEDCQRRLILCQGLKGGGRTAIDVELDRDSSRCDASKEGTMPRRRSIFY